MFFFNECAAISSPELESRMLGCLLWKNKFITDNYCHKKKPISIWFWNWSYFGLWHGISECYRKIQAHHQSLFFLLPISLEVLSKFLAMSHLPTTDILITISAQTFFMFRSFSQNQSHNFSIHVKFLYLLKNSDDNFSLFPSFFPHFSQFLKLLDS